MKQVITLRKSLRNVKSEGVISLFDSKSVGENYNLFDPTVMDEISKMKEKNIAVEILKKLMPNRWLYLNGPMSSNRRSFPIRLQNS